MYVFGEGCYSMPQEGPNEVTTSKCENIVVYAIIILLNVSRMVVQLCNKLYNMILHFIKSTMLATHYILSKFIGMKTYKY